MVPRSRARNTGMAVGLSKSSAALSIFAAAAQSRLHDVFNIVCHKQYDNERVGDAGSGGDRAHSRGQIPTRYSAPGDLPCALQKTS